MAQTTEALAPQPQSLLQFPWVKQLLGLAGLALAVAVGVVVALWSQQPNYAQLFNELTDRDAQAITQALRARQVEFRIDQRTGAVLVPQSQLRDLRMQLAAEGLPQGSSPGMEILQQEPSLGTSRFVENARYKHALEAELARSISTLRNVETARVHLALPKQSIFIRERIAPGASVVVKLFPGRTLEQGQVNAVVHLVASSIPQLETGNVTVVDQMGRLLSEGADEPLALTGKEFDYTRRVEDDYSDRIVRLLEPLVGPGRVRAQVTAVLDFTRSETTQESFDAEQRALRSEQLNAQESRGATGAVGIPGALSNQPPGAGTTEPGTAAQTEAGVPSSQSSSEVRNFEVPRSIVHTRRPMGTIERLTVAVIVDDRQVAGDGGGEATPYEEQELTRFTTLVKDAIGFSEERGDRVNLINSSFLRPELAELPDVPLWEQPWVWDLGKQILGGMFVLLLLLLFVRPAIKTLGAAPQLPPPAGAGAGAPGAGADARGRLAEDRLQLSGGEGASGGEESNYEQKLELARSLVKGDPARVANLVKTWVADSA